MVSTIPQVIVFFAHAMDRILFELLFDVGLELCGFAYGVCFLRGSIGKCLADALEEPKYWALWYPVWEGSLCYQVSWMRNHQCHLEKYKFLLRNENTKSWNFQSEIFLTITWKQYHSTCWISSSKKNKGWIYEQMNPLQINVLAIRQ